MARIVRHHVVEINSDPKAVCDLHEANEVALRAIFCRERARLIDIAEVEAIEGVKTHRIGSSARFKRRRQPERVVTGLRKFWHPRLDLRPRGVEILQNHLAPERPRESKKADDESL